MKIELTEIESLTAAFGEKRNNKIIDNKLLEIKIFKSVLIYLSKNNIKKHTKEDTINNELEVLVSEKSLVSSLGKTKIKNVGTKNNNKIKIENIFIKDIFKSFNLIIISYIFSDPINRKTNKIADI